MYYSKGYFNNMFSNSIIYDKKVDLMIKNFINLINTEKKDAFINNIFHFDLSRISKYNLI